MSKQSRTYVGFGVPIHERADGVLLIGTRRFTGKELARYLKNMYGESYFRRMAIIRNKRMTPEQRHERAMKAVQTKIEKYTAQELAEIVKKQIEGRRRNPNYASYVAEKVRLMHTPEAEAKRKAIWDSKVDKITDNHHWVNRYFICDCEIDGQEFHEGEWIVDSDALYEKANAMMLVYPLSQLSEDTRKTAIHLRTKMHGCKWRVKYWLACRPNVIFEIFQTCNVI